MRSREEIEQFYREGRLNADVFIDGMTREASAIHTAYPHFLKQNIQRRTLRNDSPFISISVVSSVPSSPSIKVPFI